MLTYNTALKKLTLPEYGRNIQQMVDHCLTIEDRAERTRCAGTIVNAMATLLPKIREQEGWQQKLWDHLAIMSDFQLDIDWPMEPVGADAVVGHPEKFPYPQHTPTYRNYGRTIQRMIAKAVQMEGGDEKDALIMLLANQMKKTIAQINGTAEDARIFADLAAISHGEITLDPAIHVLPEYKFLPTPSGKKKKKK